MYRVRNRFLRLIRGVCDDPGENRIELEESIVRNV